MMSDEMKLIGESRMVYSTESCIHTAFRMFLRKLDQAKRG